MIELKVRPEVGDLHQHFGWKLKDSDPIDAEWCYATDFGERDDVALGGLLMIKGHGTPEFLAIFMGQLPGCVCALSNGKVLPFRGAQIKVIQTV